MEILAEEGGGSPGREKISGFLSIMSKVNEKINEGIRVSELDALRRKVKLGDKIRIRIVKASSKNIGGSYDGVLRTGIVVAKYPRLAVLEFSGGTRETVTWLDLLLEKKKSKRGAKS